MSIPRRSKGKRIDIDYSATLAFFEARGKREYANVLSATMYQDQSPALVEQRDRAEKALLGPQLPLHAGDRVLDIGCGIGRWGWFVQEQAPDALYLGIDFSLALIEKARAEAVTRGKSGLHFQHMSATDIRPEALDVPAPFDLVIIAGLLMYLNEDDCVRLLTQAVHLCAPGGHLYLREPLGVQDRLTLDRFYSNELQDEYSAVYRTVPELERLLALAAPSGTLRTLASDFLFPEDLEKRAETRQYFCILKKAD